MKIAIAIDSFKGSMSSQQAGEAIAEGIRRVDSAVDIRICPLADGGEGTVDVIVSARRGAYREIPVHGPDNAPDVCARYGICGDTAVIEMAAAAGITLMPPEKRNPLYTTTYGVGEMISDALSQGLRRIIMAIGGSATNDGGAGMLQALGFRLMDAFGKDIPAGAIGLESIASLAPPEGFAELLSQCDITVACDVVNPLCGPMGASAIYGPQKGATPDMVPRLDSALAHFADVARKAYPASNPQMAGAGAAGGLGYALATFLDAHLKSGIDIVLKENNFDDMARWADVVITGEGRIDAQTAMGKAPCGVAAIAKKYGKTVLAFCGCASADANAVNNCGIDAFFPIARGACSLADAMDIANASRNAVLTAEQVFRLLTL